MEKRAQISMEYMILIGFITFLTTALLVISVFFSDQIEDKLRLNQAENFAIQLLNSAESVFFAGEPSKTTVRLYLPDGVNEIKIIDNYLLINISTSNGDDVRGFKSDVPINGTISSGEGIKYLTVEAKENYVLIS